MQNSILLKTRLSMWLDAELAAVLSGRVVAGRLQRQSSELRRRRCRSWWWSALSRSCCRSRRSPGGRKSWRPRWRNLPRPSGTAWRNWPTLSGETWTKNWRDVLKNVSVCDPIWQREELQQVRQSCSSVDKTNVWLSAVFGSSLKLIMEAEAEAEAIRVSESSAVSGPVLGRSLAILDLQPPGFQWFCRSVSHENWSCLITSCCFSFCPH